MKEANDGGFAQP